MPKRYLVIMTSICLSVFGLALAANIWPMGTHQTWEQCGGIQIVGSADELWCFIEVDRMVNHPGLFGSPPYAAYGHSQTVIVVSPSGSSRRTEVSAPNGVRFHPNISHIFRLDDGFHLYQGFSINTHRSLYRWSEDHFELLPLEESEQLLTQTSLASFDPADDTIDEIQLADGWVKVLRARDAVSFDEPVFEWNGAEFQIMDTESEGRVTLLLRSVNDPSWTVELVSFDDTRREISDQEFQALCDRPQQDGHPR